ncbi:DUF3592 domain-containing protein [uncultured Ramlibacter sp.]|uniref:DUF3592 domain-containing protein n=1 Tax=uncultured Ramlibacter sp. TaxID=260755 RepID=UPI00260397CE|nr:DUF3592 domain-containing protein [uncultured Ramlibacter sp.]
MQSRSRSPIDAVTAWVTALAAAACVALAVLQTPIALQDMQEDASLDADGQVTKGRVTAHRPDEGAYLHRSAATVVFHVHGRPYEASLEGEGATPERLPVGASVDVAYLPATPEVSRASAPDAQTSRLTLMQLGALWVLAVALCAAAWFQYRRSQ